MRLYLTAVAEDDLERLPAYLQKRIVAKLELYAKQPDPLQFAQPLTGSSYYRFRIGDQRIFFEVLNNTLWILRIKRRDQTYR
jgi:mRNA-degrading endonuclease RelE of RelBE toxin-antitoxin system